jgi:ribose transport system permease protein
MSENKRAARRWDLGAVAPFVALALICALGAFVNPRFLRLDNIANVLARSTFIATIAVGQTLVIASGGLDLSVGSMAALVAGLEILFLNSGLVSGRWPSRLSSAASWASSTG